MHSTGQPLDFGIAGAGYFAVQTAQGVRYTRDGQFSTNAAGQLVDSAGDQVLSQTGAPISVWAKGTVARLRARRVQRHRRLQAGRQPFTGTRRRPGRGRRATRASSRSSGVDPIQTMTDMIASLRAYQAGQSAIQSIDQTMQENASNIGSLGG